MLKIRESIILEEKEMASRVESKARKMLTIIWHMLKNIIN